MSADLESSREDELGKALTPEEQQTVAEVNFLARQLYDKYHELVEYYKTYEKLSTTDAIAKAEAVPHENYLAHLRTKPINQFTWWDINTSPEDTTFAIDVWQEIKEAAKEDVTSGSYAFSKVLDKSPYELGLYLAIRSAFSEQWKPHRGSGRTLRLSSRAR